ncbi:MAG: hypothetical protein K9N47_20000 [Prosthecobacter sp.]|uniref:hypothetical protein n=1 Tax=Prosthecobacter sp. TaxID=1965333 RepID=UPI0025DCF9AC|nr:hypothetical protein [Prosthecobacter sp.]MCF7788414.1 hypothetical protein [Prosthecobacter sp.]
MQTSTQPQRPQPPYCRWFCYLLLAAILTVVNPYFHSPDDRFYSPSIGTYMETPSGMKPTAMKIHLDGRTYGQLVASRWTEWGLIIVGIEALVFVIRRLRK